MGAALRAIADDRTGLVEERPEIDVFIGENSRRHRPRRGAADDNGSLSRLSISWKRSKRLLIREGRGVAAEGFETRDFSEGIASLPGSPHFFEDVGKQDVLPRLIGLSRYSTALSLICLFKTLLPQADRWQSD